MIRLGRDFVNEPMYGDVGLEVRPSTLHGQGGDMHVAWFIYHALGWRLDHSLDLRNGET